MARRGRPAAAAAAEHGGDRRAEPRAVPGAQPSLEQIDIALDEAIVLDVRDAHAFAAGHRPGAVNVPVSGSSLRDEGGVRAARAPGRDRRDATRRPKRARGASICGGRHLRRRRLARGRRHRACRAGDDRRARAQPRRGRDPAATTSARQTSATPASSRVAAISRTATRARRRRTVSAASGRSSRSARAASRAAIAASVLHAAGLDARPVLDGGIAAWQARGGELRDASAAAGPEGRKEAARTSCGHVVRTSPGRRDPRRVPRPAAADCYVSRSAG